MDVLSFLCIILTSPKCKYRFLPLKASSYLPSCIALNPKTSPSLNVFGGSGIEPSCDDADGDEARAVDIRCCWCFDVHNDDVCGRSEGGFDGVVVNASLPPIHAKMATAMAMRADGMESGFIFVVVL